MRAHSFLALTCSLLAASLFAGEMLRFSQSLTAEQRTTAGIDQLNSDQVAALDALVRLDAHKAAAGARKVSAAKKKAESAAPAAAAATTTAELAPTSFTQGLSTDQRRAAGLDTLSTAQQGAVDSLVAQQISPTTTRQEIAATSVEAVEFFPNRFEVHGEVGFSFGGGSGYSSREAWMTTTLLDTKTGTELSVGVSSGREKWKGPYRYRDSWDDVSLGLGVPLFRSR